MIWREIRGYEGVYDVSENGDVRRSIKSIGIPGSRPGRILKPVTNGHYLKVHLSVGNHVRQIYIHHLVAQAFVGERPEGLDINHKDGIKTNNHYTNLEYVSALENTRHAIRNGKWNHDGEHNGHARLTWQKVREIRELKSQGWTNKELAERYSIVRNAICQIINGKRWKDRQQLPVVQERCG